MAHSGVLQLEISGGGTRGRVRAFAIAAVRSPLLWIAALTLAGFALRLAFVLSAGTLPLGGDPSWYYNVATNIARGHGFVADHRTLFEGDPIIGEPTAAWPPAFSYVLAALWKITGVSVTSAKVLNAVLAAFTIPFVYLLARSIFNRPAGWLAAGVFAIFPNAIAWTPVLFPEQLFTLVFVAALWLLVEPRALGASSARTVVAFGALAGIATLTRGEGVVLLPVAALFWLTRDGWRGAARTTLFASVVMALTILPWTVRNWVVMGEPVPVATNSGIALRIGHSPQATGTTEITDPPEPIDGVPATESQYYRDTELRAYHVYTDRSIRYALTHFRRELDLTRYKIYHLYRSDAWVVEWVKLGTSTPLRSTTFEDRLWRVFDVSHYILMFSAVASALFWLRRTPKQLLLANVILMYTLFHIVFSAEPRYHVPLFPIFAVAAAGGVCIAISSAMRLIRPHTL